MSINSLKHYRALTYISDPIHGRFALNIFDRDLVDSRCYQRLHFLSQTSATYAAYPSNKGTRFPHSLGVSHLAGKMFSSALSSASSEDLEVFLEKGADFLEKLIGVNRGSQFWRDGKSYNKEHFETISGLSGFVHSPIRPESTSPRIDTEDTFGERNLKASFIIDTLWQSIRLYGLWHDIGHLPLCHAFESGLQKADGRAKSRYQCDGDLKEKIGDLVRNIRKDLPETPIEASDRQQTIRREEVLEDISAVFSVDSWSADVESLDKSVSRKALHEARGLNIFIKYIMEKTSDPIENALNEEFVRSRGLNLDINGYSQCINMVALAIYFSKFLIKGHLGKSPDGSPHPFSFLYTIRQIVDGNVDSDRLDYTLRDCYEAGASFGTYDVDRVVSNCVLVRKGETSIFNVAFNYRTVSGIEQFYSLREQSYRYIINHRTSSRTNVCFEHLVSALFIHSTIAANGLVGVVMNRYGYIATDDSGSSVKKFLPADGRADRVDDYTFRSLLLDLESALNQKGCCTQSSDDTDSNSNNSPAVLETIERDIKCLLQVVLHRNFNHIITIGKDQKAWELIAKLIGEKSASAPRSKKFLDEVFKKDIVDFNRQRLTKRFFHLLGDDACSTYVVLHRIFPKTYKASYDMVEDVNGHSRSTFETKVLVLLTDGRLKELHHVSGTLNDVMENDEGRGVDMRMYVASHLVKSDSQLVQRIEKAMGQAVNELCDEIVPQI